MPTLFSSSRDSKYYPATQSFRSHVKSILTKGTEQRYFIFYDGFQGHPSISNTNWITSFYILNCLSFCVVKLSHYNSATCYSFVTKVKVLKESIQLKKSLISFKIKNYVWWCVTFGGLLWNNVWDIPVQHPWEASLKRFSLQAKHVSICWKMYL